jgi:uncharacterized membrane protein YjgN (DUF898 family)
MADMAIEAKAPSHNEENIRLQKQAQAPRSLASSSPAASETSDPQQFEFTGTGGEYFRIWIVNVLLTIATLGIYSAWAKARRLQYFYRNTRVAGAIFDYRGNPKAILKGRILALGLLASYKLTFDFYKPAAIGIALILIVIMPWLLARAFRFKMANSTYRGVRFHFRGTVAQAYKMLILFPVLFAVTGLLIWSLVTSFANRQSIALILTAVILPMIVIFTAIPLAHYLLKRYQHDNAYFGHMPFFFDAPKREFFKTYGKAIGYMIVGSMAVGIFAAVTGKLYTLAMETSFAWLFEILYGLLTAYLGYLFVMAYLEGTIQNLVWNHTTIAGMRFESAVQTKQLLAIHASNLALITLTLGFYKPFAAVKRMKYRIESVTLVPLADDLETILADQANDHAGAIGQEAGDLFDIDIAI